MSEKEKQNGQSVGERAWRIIQDQPCRVLYPFYQETMEARAVTLVGKKQAAAKLLRLRENGIKEGGGERNTVKLLLEDGTAYPLDGTLQFSDVTVDQSTGSVTLRAVFPNPDKVLLPGMFVEVRMQGQELTDVIVVPRAKAREVAEYAQATMEGDKAGRRNLYKELGLPSDPSVE